MIGFSKNITLDINKHKTVTVANNISEVAKLKTCKKFNPTWKFVIDLVKKILQKKVRREQYLVILESGFQLYKNFFW